LVVLLNRIAFGLAEAITILLFHNKSSFNLTICVFCEKGLEFAGRRGFNGCDEAG
jgi:hypothetical protein